MFKKVMLFVIIGVVLAGMACAQEGMMGKNEVSFAAAWASVAEMDMTLVVAHYGRFVTPNLEAQLGLIWADAGFEGESVSALAIAPAVSWNFISANTTNIVPYLGVGWYFINLDADGDSENTNGLEAFAGVKFFVGGDYKCSNRAVFVEYRYLNDIMDENVNTVMVGITNFF